jgi:hypothetical protein
MPDSKKIDAAKATMHAALLILLDDMRNELSGADEDSGRDTMISGWIRTIEGAVAVANAERGERFKRNLIATLGG